MGFELPISGVISVHITNLYHTSPQEVVGSNPSTVYWMDIFLICLKRLIINKMTRNGPFLRINIHCLRFLKCLFRLNICIPKRAYAQIGFKSLEKFFFQTHRISSYLLLLLLLPALHTHTPKLSSFSSLYLGFVFFLSLFVNLFHFLSFYIFYPLFSFHFCLWPIADGPSN